jgi:serine protease Do
MNKFSKLMFGFFATTLGALAILFLFHFTLLGKEAALSINVDTTPVARDASPATSFAPIVKKAAPSVVNIYSSRTVKVRPMRSPFQDDPVFRQFFGDQFPDDGRAHTHKEQSLGSGVIVSADGYILTANHVVEGADEIKVAIGENKNEFTAKVIGTDPQTDVAVLKIDAKDLPAITLGDSDQLEVGDVVLAIGNPFGVGQTVTMGIVSALGRNGFNFGGQAGAIENFIQTDAAINPGNSGGALVDAEGRLIGINTAIITGGESRGNDGIGFAVPINMARHVMERLISGGKITHGYLGINLQDISGDLAKQFGLSDQNGALVDDVITNTPAEKAGIKSGDVIIEFNGKPVTDANSLLLGVSESEPGTSVAIKLIRNNSPKTVTVKLGDRPGELAENGSGQNSSQPGNSNSTTDALDGVTVDDLDRDTRQQLRIPNRVQGAIVTDVAADSNSAEAGLQKGDVIEEINRQPITSADEAKKVCDAAKGDQILLKIWRRTSRDFASTRFFTVDNMKKDTKEK